MNNSVAKNKFCLAAFSGKSISSRSKPKITGKYCRPWPSKILRLNCEFLEEDQQPDFHDPIDLSLPSENSAGGYMITHFQYDGNE